MSKKTIFMLLSVFCLASCLQDTSYTPYYEPQYTPRPTPINAEEPLGDNLVLQISDGYFDCDTDLMGRAYSGCNFSFDIMVKDPEYRSKYDLKSFNIICSMSVDYWTIGTYTKTKDPFPHTARKEEFIYLTSTNIKEHVKISTHFSGLVGDAYKANVSSFKCSMR